MIIKVEDLKHSYNNNRVLFENVNFSLEKSDILTILGPNGAGKSTMLDAITNIITPTSGNIYIKGKNIMDLTDRQIAQSIGYVSQIHSPVYEYSVLEYVLIGLSPWLDLFERPGPDHVDLALDILSQLSIIHLKDSHISQISGGERQKATIAKVLIQDPDLIILDEPTSFLDFGNQHKTIGLVRSLADKGYAIIMTTHQPNHALSLGSYTGILDGEGNFIYAKSADIVKDDILSQIYDVEVKSYFDKKTNCRIIYTNL